MNGADLQARVLLAHGASPHVRLFRNTVGEGWQGREVIGLRTRDTVTLRNPRYVTFGLAPGSSDLIGWRARLIGPADVGTLIAQFLAWEIKGRNDRLRSNQSAFLETVERFGGCGVVVRSEEDAAAILKGGES